MTDPYFHRTSGDDSSGRYVAGELTAGPWSPALQHGGPPNALAVVLADRAVRAATGRADLVALRLAADFSRPVPVGECDVRTRVLRAGRSAALAEVTVSTQGRDCLTTGVWFVRDVDTSAVVPPTSPPPAPAPAKTAGRGADSDFAQWRFGYARSLAWRYTAGRPDELGPAAAWARPLHPLLEDDVLDGDPAGLPGLAKVVLVADSASGISAELDWHEWSFVNVDLDVHLSRPFDGEWVHMDAVSTLGAHGSALARSTLSDHLGVVGAGAQTLVLSPLAAS